MTTISEECATPPHSQIITIHPTVRWAILGFVAAVIIMIPALSNYRLPYPLSEWIGPEYSEESKRMLDGLWKMIAFLIVCVCYFWLHKKRNERLLHSPPQKSSDSNSDATLQKAIKTYGFEARQSLTRLLGHWCGFGKTYQVGDTNTTIPETNDSISKQSPFHGPRQWWQTIGAVLFAVCVATTLVIPSFVDIHDRTDWPILAHNIIGIVFFTGVAVSFLIRRTYAVFPGGVTTYWTATLFGKWKPKTFLREESTLVYWEGTRLISVASPGQSSIFRIRRSDMSLFMGTWLKPCENDVNTASSGD